MVYLPLVSFCAVTCIYGQSVFPFSVSYFEIDTIFSSLQEVRSVVFCLFCTLNWNIFFAGYFYDICITCQNNFTYVLTIMTTISMSALILSDLSLNFYSCVFSLILYLESVTCLIIFFQVCRWGLKECFKFFTEHFNEAKLCDAW